MAQNRTARALTASKPQRGLHLVKTAVPSAPAPAALETPRKPIHLVAAPSLNTQAIGPALPMPSRRVPEPHAPVALPAGMLRLALAAGAAPLVWALHQLFHSIRF